MNDLHEIIKKYPKTDKLRRHNYLKAYSMLFSGHTGKTGSLLEVGVQRGDSLRMWKDYLPGFNIYGLDCDPESMFKEERIETFLCDSHEEQQVNDVLKGLEFDIAIDDGDHDPMCQSRLFKAIWKKLKVGGIYCIEDIYKEDLRVIEDYIGILPSFEYKILIDGACSRKFCENSIIYAVVKGE